MTLPSRRTVTRRALLSAVGIVTAVLVAGCASVLEGDGSGGGGTDVPGPTTYDHPSGAEDVLVTIKSDGGYSPVEFNLRNTAEFTLIGDGTAVVQGPMIELYPGPAINPLQSATLTEQQIQDLYAAADQAGLLGEEVDFGEPGVTDLPYTTVSITVGDRTVVQQAYALGFSDDPAAGLGEAEVAARQALQGFIDTTHAAVGSATAAYEPTGVVAYRLSDEAGRPAEEPELQQPPQTWPITTAPAAPTADSAVATCVTVTGPEAVTVLDTLAQANELTPWLIGGDPPARMVFRPLLPGDPGCEK